MLFTCPDPGKLPEMTLMVDDVMDDWFLAEQSVATLPPLHRIRFDIPVKSNLKETDAIAQPPHETGFSQIIPVVPVAGCEEE